MNDPRITHAGEQGGAALREMARMMAGFRDELLIGGFTRAEATEFCKEWMRLSISGASQGAAMKDMMRDMVQKLIDNRDKLQ